MLMRRNQSQAGLCNITYFDITNFKPFLILDKQNGQDMPLYLQSKTLKVPQSVDELVFEFPHIKVDAENLKSKPIKTITERVLYIFQQEYATVVASDDTFDFIGTDDATTCHVVVLRHTGSNVTSLGHFDGHGCKQFVTDTIKDTVHWASQGPDGRYELHIIGGFLDPRNESWKVTRTLLGEFCRQDLPIQLATCCVTDLNNIKKGDVNFPVIYGIGVNIKTGEIFPATFPVKEPAAALRSCLAFAGYKKYHNVYDPVTHEVVVGPYQWSPQPHLEVYLNLPSDLIRKYLSTSPEQEPAGFEEHVYTALETILSHPHPNKTLFPNGQPLLYQLQGDHWCTVTRSNSN